MSNLYIKGKWGTKAAQTAASVVNGTLRVANDTQELFVDINNQRVSVASIVTGLTEAQIKAQSVANILPKIYISSDTNTLFWYSVGETEWVVVGGDSVAFAEAAEKAEKDADGNVITSTYQTVSDATTDYNTLDGKIDDLAAVVAGMNSFEIRTVSAYSDLPVPGTSNIIYFVPSSVTDQNNNKFDEYIWISNEQETSGGHYENIGTTEADLQNYYTKSEIDSTVQTINGTISDLDTAYKAADQTINGLISDMDTAYKAADTALSGRVGTLETTVGNSNSGLVKDVSDLQTEVGDATNPDAASLRGRMATAESDIDSLETEVGAAQNPDAASLRGRMATAESDIDALETDVASINRFAKSIVDELPEVANADPYTIYFVPETGLAGNDKKYAEYIYVAAHTVEAADPSDNVTIPAHFERLGSSADFSNYYTKSEVDGFTSTLQSNIGTNSTAISGLQGTVSDMDTAYKAADSALDGRLDDLEAEVGAASNPDAASLRGRMATLETTVGDASSGLIKTVADNYSELTDADSALDGRLDVIEAALGDYPDEAGTDTITDRLDAIEDAIGEGSGSSLADRIGAAEGEIDDLQTEVGAATNPDAASLRGRMATAEGDIDAIETEIGAATNPDAASLRGRMAAAETDIDNLEAADTAMDTRVDAIEDEIGAAQNPGATTLRGRVASLETTVGDANSGLVKTVADNYSSLDTAIGSVASDLAALTTAVGNINRFNIVVLEAGESLPAVGAEYTIYFVPQATDVLPNNYNIYDEYMWVVKEDAQGQDASHYEKVGVTEAEFANYYTKSEVDGIKTTLEAADTAIGLRIDGVDSTIEAMDTAYKAADTALDGRLDVIEAALGDYPDEAGTETITDRLDTIEAAIGEGSGSSLADRIGAAENAIDDLEDALGDASNPDADTVYGRLDTAEDDIDDLQTEVGAASNPDAASLRGRMATAEGDIDAIETEIGAAQNPDSASLRGRMATAEGDIDDLETELASHDFKYAGSQTENGAADNVVETSDSTNADREILFANSDHDAVNYASTAKINPSTGMLTVNSIKLGGAVLTFDSVSESLVVNF